MHTQRRRLIHDYALIERVQHFSVTQSNYIRTPFLNPAYKQDKLTRSKRTKKEPACKQYYKAHQEEHHHAQAD